MRRRHDLEHWHVKDRQRYRYYRCSPAARVGKAACKGHSVPMDRLVRFGQLMRTNITEGEVPFRQAYLRSLVEAVPVTIWSDVALDHDL